MTKINDKPSTIRAFRSGPDNLKKTTSTIYVNGEAFWPYASQRQWRELTPVPPGVDVAVWMHRRYGEKEVDADNELRKWANKPLQGESQLPEVLQEALQQRRTV